MRLTKRQSKALKASLVKWEKIVEGTGRDQGVYNCPLCANYYRDHSRDVFKDEHCKGCPVRNTSGQLCCRGTPYVKWNTVFPKTNDLGSGYIHTAPSLLAAKKMRDYLKDILTNSTKK